MNLKDALFLSWAIDASSFGNDSRGVWTRFPYLVNLNQHSSSSDVMFFFAWRTLSIPGYSFVKRTSDPCSSCLEHLGVILQSLCYFSLQLYLATLPLYHLIHSTYVLWIVCSMVSFLKVTLENALLLDLSYNYFYFFLEAPCWSITCEY